MSWRNAAMAGFAIGCGSESVVDRAEICIAGEEDAAGFTEPDSVEIQVGERLVLRALSEFGCHTTDHVVDCYVAEAAPGEVVVTTETSWRRNEPLVMGCESMYRTAVGFCETPPLPEGPVLLRFDGRALAFDVPGTARGCLLGNGADE